MKGQVKKMDDPRYMEIFDIEMLDEDTFQLELLPDVSYENDYEKFRNKPKINGVELLGDKSFEELGRKKMTNRAIQDIVDSVYEDVFNN